MSTPPRPARIQSLAGSVPQALAMLAGMELDLFSALEAGPLTTEQIASTVGVQPERVGPLLAALVAAQMLTAEQGRFVNTPESGQFLVRGRPDYMGGVYELWSEMWRAEMQTARSVRSGVPQARHDFNTMSPEELYAFIRGSHSGAVAAARHLLAVRDLSQSRMLLDVGGGSGGFAICAAQSLPQLQATVIELPIVTPIAQRFVTDAALNERVQVAGVDVVHEPLPCRGDVAVCNRFIQVLAPDDARQAIAYIAESLTPGGSLHIIGHILDDTRLSPPPAVAYGLLALNLYDGGQAFTEQQHRDWLSDASLTNIERTMLPNGYSLMSARKRDT